MASSALSFRSINYPVLDEQERLQRIVQFARVIATRRSVREFSAEPVPFELIDQAIAIANTAPSGANKQPWRFVVVENVELKRRLRIAAEKEEWEFYHNRATPEWLADILPLGISWQKPYMESAPYLIVVFRQDYELRLGPDGTPCQHSNYHVNESVGIAVGFLLAALHVAGLATLVHTPSPMGFLVKELGRPANERPFAIIPVGYPAENAQAPDLVKKSLEDVRLRL